MSNLNTNVGFEEFRRAFQSGVGFRRVFKKGKDLSGLSFRQPDESFLIERLIHKLEKFAFQNLGEHGILGARHSGCFDMFDLIHFSTVGFTKSASAQWMK